MRIRVCTIAMQVTSSWMYIELTLYFGLYVAAAAIVNLLSCSFELAKLCLMHAHSKKGIVILTSG